MPTKAVRLLVVIVLLAVKTISSLTFSTKNHLHPLKKSSFLWNSSFGIKKAPLCLDKNSDSIDGLSPWIVQRNRRQNGQQLCTKYCYGGKGWKARIGQTFFLANASRIYKKQERRETKPHAAHNGFECLDQAVLIQIKAAPEQAKALLKKVEQALQVFGALGIKVDAICCSCVINCWAKSPPLSYGCSRSRAEAAKDNETTIP
jgi:hypothetical protein